MQILKNRFINLKFKRLSERSGMQRANTILKNKFINMKFKRLCERSGMQCIGE